MPEIGVLTRLYHVAVTPTVLKHDQQVWGGRSPRGTRIGRTGRELQGLRLLRPALVLPIGKLAISRLMPLDECVGAGAGLDSPGVAHKIEVLRGAERRIQVSLGARPDPQRLLAECGGFEIVMIAGTMLRAAALGMVVLVDGFIATAALLAARAMNPNMLDYCVFSHCSDEQRHREMLDMLGGQPLLALAMRLGEGSGAALAYPIVASAVAFLNQMASFESAAVSGKKEDG